MKKENDFTEELMEKSESLLKDMENRIYDMSKQHENNFLTLVGFLIATSGIMITSDNIECNVKCLLVWSIFFFVLGLFMSNNLYGAQIFKLKKGLNSVLKISESTKVEDIMSTQAEADNHLKINKKDIVFGTLATISENIGLVLFVIGLFKFL